jgi:hypothetical protein
MDWTLLDRIDRVGAFAVVRERMGTLTLPSRRLVTTDPHGSLDRAPEARIVPATPAAVTMYQADKKLELTSAVVVARWSEEPVLRWIELDGYGVDAAVGMFADAEWAQEMADEEDGFAADYAHRQDTYWTWMGGPKGKEEGKAVAFATGFGDGSYPVYWGLGKDDAVVCVVTAFDVFKASALEKLSGWERCPVEREDRKAPAIGEPPGC